MCWGQQGAFLESHLRKWGETGVFPGMRGHGRLDATGDMQAGSTQTQSPLGQNVFSGSRRKISPVPQA